MEIVNAEGWKAVYLSSSGDTVSDYLPCGLGVYATDVKVWVENLYGEESVVGLDLEPLEDGYSSEDLEWAPDTVPGFIGYLPPDAPLSFLDRRAIMVSNEVNGIEWVRGEKIEN